MNKALLQIINNLKSDGRDYLNFKEFLQEIDNSGMNITKDEVLDFVSNDSRIQLHTTPNSIAKLVSKLAKSFDPQTAIDICCGTGNILYFLQNEIDDLSGVELVDNVAELTKYFMPEINIITADSLKYPFTRKYDLVVGNIPFGLGIDYNGKHMPTEEAFIRKAHDLLSDNGKLIMLIPYTVLFNERFKNFRSDFTAYLHEIIGFPAGKIRTTQIRTALVILNKRPTGGVKIVQLEEFDNLDAEYDAVIKSDYSKHQFTDRWDPEFHFLRDNKFYCEIENFQTKYLKDLADIIKGKSIPSDKLKQDGDYLYIKPTHIKNGQLNSGKSKNYISKRDLKDHDLKFILQPGDIVISTILSDLKMYIYRNNDVPAFASDNIAVIRSSKQDYILSYLQTDEGRRIFKHQADDFGKGASIPHLNIKDLASIKIPILPVDDLNAIGDMGISESSEAQLQSVVEFLSSQKEIISKLLEVKEIVPQFLKFIDDRFNRVEEQLERINHRLDEVLLIVKELKTDFKQIQKLPKDTEVIFLKLCQKIDNKLDNVYENDKRTIDNYVEEVKRWLDLWDLLDFQSQKFLPIAELIFDELSKIEEADFAPFVVQYCRTLENEILKKLFESYHKNGLRNTNIDELVTNDLAKSQTSKFAKMVKQNRPIYTLGDMNFIMGLLKQGGRTLSESPLLIHFRAFAISYFNEKILEAEFLNDVQKITVEFRNRAAHPSSIGLEVAKDCQELLRKNLNIFLDNIKIHEN